MPRIRWSRIVRKRSRLSRIEPAMPAGCVPHGSGQRTAISLFIEAAACSCSELDGADLRTPRQDPFQVVQEIKDLPGSADRPRLPHDVLAPADDPPGFLGQIFVESADGLVP